MTMHVVAFGLVKTGRRFRGAYCFMMEAISTYETSLNFCGTTREVSQNTVIFILAAVRIRNLTFIVLMMEAVRTSETSIFSTRLHGTTSHKTFVIAALIT